MIIFLLVMVIISIITLINRNYRYLDGQLKYQDGYYMPSREIYIYPHYKTWPDNYKWNNRKYMYGW